jgi:HAD superfamily hydrolase (TIGR01509 family)
VTTFPRRIEAVVFDMDGLLVDSEAPFRDAMMAAAAEMDRELPLSVFLQLVGRAHAQSNEILRDHFGADFRLEPYFERVRFLNREATAGGACLKAGAIELLDHLDQAQVPRAICTSSAREMVDRHLGDLVPRFQAVVSRDDVVRGKPHPEPYLAAAAALGVDPGLCLALEDSHNGVRAAHAAGMMTVMVPDLLDPTEEMRSLCVHIAETLHEVHALVSRAAI